MTRLLLVSLSCCFVASAHAEAQVADTTRPATDSLAALAIADRLARTGDTAGAVRVLRIATDAAPRNAALWYAYGSMLYAWTRPHWRRNPMPNGIPSRIIAAESSLARAMILAPDSAHYAIEYARNLFGSNPYSLSAAQRAQYAAMASAERVGDTAMTARSAGHLGLLLWRKYEQDADEYLENPGVIVEAHRPGQLEKTAKRRYALIKRPIGLALYNEALEYFRYARLVAHDDEEAFRREAMALAAKQRWSEMRSAAVDRRTLRPQQAWPWLVIGLADHRMSKYASAQQAFDSGFARLPEQDRYRLLFLPRLWRPGAERKFDTLPEAERDRINRLYFVAADPSLQIPGNPVRTEFMARVVHAEISWTDDERPVKGAQTPKGEVHIRFGPADFMANNRWYYFTPIDTFFEFGQRWGTGTAGLLPWSQGLLDSLRDQFGSTFYNLPTVRRGVDSIETQVARFRASGDSIDLFIASHLPVGSLKRDLATNVSNMRSAVFTVDASGTILSDQRSTISISGGARNSAVLRTQKHRTVTRAALARVELLEPDAERVARAVIDISDFAATGFGISDVILSPSITAPAAPDVARWSAFDVQPSMGNSFGRNTRLDLLWEVYGLASQDGTSRHRVAIAMERVTDRGFVAATVRVIGGLRNAISGGQSQSRAISYERTLPVRDALAESLRLDLAGSAVGRYRLTLTITDLTTGIAVLRTRDFNIVNAK